MSFLNKCLAVFVAFAALPLILWLTTSFVNRHDYLNLIRGGLLICGLGSIAWGVLWHNKGGLIAIGVTLLLIGFLSFHVDDFSEGAGFAPLDRSEFTYRLHHFLSYPIQRYPYTPLCYALVGLWVILNVVMFAQRIPHRAIIAANAVVVVGIVLMAMVWPS